MKQALKGGGGADKLPVFKLRSSTILHTLTFCSKKNQQVGKALCLCIFLFFSD